MCIICGCLYWFFSFWLWAVFSYFLHIWSVFVVYLCFGSGVVETGFYLPLKSVFFSQAIKLVADLWEPEEALFLILLSQFSFSFTLLKNIPQFWKLSGISMETLRCPQSSFTLVGLRLHTLSSFHWVAAEISAKLYLPSVVSVWAPWSFTTWVYILAANQGFESSDTSLSHLLLWFFSVLRLLNF